MMRKKVSRYLLLFFLIHTSGTFKTKQGYQSNNHMSAVSNMHTMSGHSNKYQFKTKYETSLVGGALGNTYDDLLSLIHI